MDTIMSCLLGFLAGALVGIPLGPSAAFALQFRLSHQYLGVFGIVVCGALSDTLVAGIVLTLAVQVSPHVPSVIVAAFSSSALQGMLLGVFGTLWYRVRFSFNRPAHAPSHIIATCLVVFAMNATAYDNYAAIGAMMTLVGIGREAFVTQTLLAFFAGSAAMWLATVEMLARAGISLGERFVQTTMRVLAVLVCIWGILLILFSP